MLILSFVGITLIYLFYLHAKIYQAPKPNEIGETAFE